MGRIKRGNYIFVTWIGDHGHHVHVEGKKGTILKWDLDKNKALEGKINKRLRKILTRLVEEGKL